MLQVYSAGNKRVEVADLTMATLPDDAVWLDLIEPTKEEEAFVERTVGVNVPTRDEAVEIEPSSRQYRDGEAIVVIASILARADDVPVATPVSFVLTPKHLVTVRYTATKAFDLFAAHAERDKSLCSDATVTLLHLLDAIVDRLADQLESVGGEMDDISAATFRRGTTDAPRMTTQTLTALLTRIGRAHDLVSKAKISGVSLGRLIGFLAAELDPKGTKERLDELAKDVTSLSDHATYVSGNLTFLLDAALGLINVEQNVVLKIYTVVATVLMPPTLIAGIYGMNFKNMPELSWPWGYPMSLVLMAASAIVPYLVFRRRGWL